MSGFVTRVDWGKEEPFTVIFTTDDHSEYLHIEIECRKTIDHAKPTTNADRIRAMTDEELADYLRWHNDLYSRNGMDWLDWLKQEADDETD